VSFRLCRNVIIFCGRSSNVSSCHYEERQRRSNLRIKIACLTAVRLHLFEVRNDGFFSVNQISISTPNKGEIMAKNILIIDDEELIIKSLRKLLEKEGYSVFIAKNGRIWPNTRTAPPLRGI